MAGQGQAAKAGTRRLHVLDVCPQLILQNKTKRFYDGYITVCVSKRENYVAV